MESNRNEQVEALKVLLEFNGRLVNNMKALVRELSGNRLEDTDKLLKSVIDALNWEIQIVNSTMEVLNDGEERIDKAAFNGVIISLSEAIASKDDLKMAEQFRQVIYVFEKLEIAVGEAIGWQA